MADTSPEPIARIGRYEVRGHLGEGGRGQVLRAFDPRLKREVALKRVRTRESAAERRRELLREARALSALQHPHIIVIYDVREEEEDLWLVEELVAGESLRTRLGRPLDPETFWGIAMDCVEALEYAASRRILHCDFKPENVMITAEGRAKVLDFGLAQRMSPSGDSSDTFVPPMGPSGGTPAYMAPEVIVGRSAGPRSDVFSLGVTFYEMLTGVSPFRRDDPSQTMSSVLEDEPEDPRGLVSGILPGLAELVMEMLRKDVHLRPESMTAVRERLERIRQAQRDPTVLSLPVPPDPAPAPAGRETRPAPAPVPRVRWIAGVAAAALILGYVAWRSMQPDFVYLVVEPFEDLSETGRDAALAAGLTERVRVELASLGELYVLEPNADPGRGLVLGGSVQREGETVQVMYHVTDRAKGRTVSGRMVEGTPGRLLQLQADVAVGARSILVARYRVAMDEPALSGEDVDPAAYGSFLQGRGFLAIRATVEDVDAAIAQFEAALEREPGWVPALAGLGEALWVRYEMTKDDATVARAQEAALEAVRLDPQSGEARETLGTVLLGRGHWSEAEREFRRAAEIQPRSVAATRGLAQARARQGDAQGAEEAYLRAIRARPDDWLALAYYGSYLASVGRDAEAVEQFTEVTRVTPGNPVGWSSLGAVNQRAGRLDEAVAAYRRSLEIRPTYAAWSNLGVALKEEGSLGDAAEAFRKALALNDRDYVVWANLASVLEQSGASEDEWGPPCRRAAERARDLLAVNPNDAAVLGKLAQLESECGFPAEAVRLAEAAIANAAGDVHVLVSAASALATTGETESACAALRRALEGGLDPELLRAEEGLPDLMDLDCFHELVGQPNGGER